MSSLTKLIDISSTPFTTVRPDLADFTARENIKIQINIFSELVTLLQTKNGFLAFESALLVLPSINTNSITGIVDWNKFDSWRGSYDGLSKNIIFFAQDLFANQYGITSSSIIRFESETGEITEYSSTLEEWASKLLSDYNFETGWSIGKEWQLKNGPLPMGFRLLGKVPFVLGGDYKVDNLKSINMNDAIKKLASLYNQIKKIPDGTKITIRNWI